MIAGDANELYSHESHENLVQRKFSTENQRFSVYISINILNIYYFFPFTLHVAHIIQ